MIILQFILSLIIFFTMIQYIMIIFGMVKAKQSNCGLSFKNISPWVFIPLGFYFLWINDSSFYYTPKHTKGMNELKEKIKYFKTQDHMANKLIDDLKDIIWKYY